MKNETAQYEIPVEFSRNLAAWQAILTQSPVKLCDQCKRMEPACVSFRCPRCGGQMRDITEDYTASVYRNFGTVQSEPRVQ